MAKKFLEGVDLKAQNSRNGFDVSYQNQFTMPFGMILPHFFQRVNPDDKLKLSNETQVICDGLVRPAFMRLKLHLDYYFIPSTQLWMPFDNFVTGQNSYFSTLAKDKNEGNVPTEVPTFTLNFLQNLFTSWNTDSLKDDLGFDFRQGATRLLDLLGYVNLTGVANHNFAYMDELGWTDNTTRFNFLPLLCYQKVYYDYFRNTKYEDNLTSAYNIDDLANGAVIDDLGTLSTRANEFFKIHYRWQKRDYFTQTQPNVLVDSTQIGYSGMGAGASTANLFNIPGYTSPSAAVITNYPSATPQNNGNFVRTGGVSGSNATQAANIASGVQANGVSVANIRFAFAYDKLLRRMREAGADFDAQMLAQFGIKPFDMRHGKCTYIGGYTNSLNSKDITNMTGDEIGELAGQINTYCDNSKKVLRFHAKEHGYVIGVISTSVENMYQSYRSSRETLLRNRFDWFNPAFENLGLQPIFAAERDYTGTLQDSQEGGRTNIFDTNSYRNIIGYVPRYSELKTHPDECHGNLCQYSDIVGYKEWNVQVNTEWGTNQVMDKSTMLLNPHQFDDVSGIPFDGLQTSDHFVVNSFNHSRKVSSMSVYETF